MTLFQCLALRTGNAVTKVKNKMKIFTFEVVRHITPSLEACRGYKLPFRASVKIPLA